MLRIDKILNHDLFIENLEKNNTAEADRRFCRHNIGHFLDVARICWIFCLEEGVDIPKEIVYAAGLLHDIGKHEQYEIGTPHEVASARIAPKILRDCGYDDKETDVILSAILSHRDSSVRDEKNLNGLLYRADKASRCCFACKASADCNWKGDKKNYSAF